MGGRVPLTRFQRQQPFRAAPGREGEHQLFEGWNLVEQIEQAGYVHDRLFFRLDADGAVKTRHRQVDAVGNKGFDGRQGGIQHLAD